ncbi:MAG: trypsin-like serine protease [Deltaproteobacteria bacterium]|nr:trypsin-like serine protease [Deltaproteobacteria bacterium]
MMKRLFFLFVICAAAGCMGMSTIQLNDGTSITAGIIEKKSDRIFVDLGFTLLAIPKDNITAVLDTSSPAQKGDFTKNLYRVLKKGRLAPIRDLVENEGGSVVTVQTPTGLGSGFIINQKGYLITNHHVIAGENRITVTVFEKAGSDISTMTKKRFENIRIVADSPDWDLALLKIDDKDHPKFSTVPIGDSDILKQGEPVFAIGNPLGLERSVSRGIVSIKNRLISGRLYVQTTAQISPGNSGGPLFNLRGEVVGVNNMKVIAAGAEGLGFAIPAAVLKMFLTNRDTFAFDPRNPNNGYRYNLPVKQENKSDREIQKN